MLYERLTMLTSLVFSIENTTLWALFIVWYVIDSFVLLQWEALALLLIGISVNQLRSLPEGTTALGLPVATGAYIYTLVFVSDFWHLLSFYMDDWNAQYESSLEKLLSVYILFLIFKTYPWMLEANVKNVFYR